MTEEPTTQIACRGYPLIARLVFFSEENIQEAHHD